MRHLDGAHYLARPAVGAGEAAAGDHLQLGWAFWLTGHQLGRLASPLEDPYSFRPEAEAPPNLQGWLLGAPYWPLRAVAGDVWAYDLLLLLTFVAAGGLTCGWLRALGLSRSAALAGGLVFALMPYRVGQSTGHLLGLASFLLPALLLALGAIPLALGYAWARLPRRDLGHAALGAGAALVAGLVVQRWAVAGSIGSGRSFAQVERYSAELSDFVTRAVGAGVEELVFMGWLVPLLAAWGLWSIRRRAGLAALLATAAVVPCLLALGANLPGYELLWRTLPGLGSTRVPERLLPIACLAVAGLAAFGLDALRSLLASRSGVTGVGPADGPSGAGAATGSVPSRLGALATALALVVVALDLRVPVFGAVAADTTTEAYAAIRGEGRLLELPVFRPDLHYGSVYLGYARQSPRERPQGYSTLAPPAADRWAREHRGLSCGRGRLPGDVGWVVVHRGLYVQSGFFGAACPDAAEQRLRREGWTRVAQDGVLTTWRRPTG